MNRKLTNNDFIEMKRLAAAGKTRAEIAKYFGVTKGVVQGMMYRGGRKLRLPTLHGNTAIIEQYEAGHSMRELASRYRTNREAVRSHLESNGVQLRQDTGRYAVKTPQTFKDALKDICANRPNGLQPDALAYFRGKISAFREAGLHARADDLEMKVSIAHQLGIDLGYALRAPATAHPTPAVME